ncbi:hypothetical protein HY993_04675 [Candidatus Micrarchaeota archaeon]|nr:hypothetical protein [Candidatus Micrarchaeota archaeon]
MIDAFYCGEEAKQGLARLESSEDWEELLDCAESRLAVGDVAAADRNISRSLELSKREHASEDALANARVALLSAIAGKPAGIFATRSIARLQGAFNGGSYKTSFLDDVSCSSAARGIASCFADAMALGCLEFKESLWRILELIRAEKLDEGDVLMGLIARKLALRNEVRPTSKVCVEFSEQVFRNLNDKYERFFTAVQIGVAKSALGDLKQAHAWISRELPHPEELTLFHASTLARASAQAGLPQTENFIGELKRSVGLLEREYQQALNEAEKTKAQGRGRVLQKRLNKSNDAAEKMFFVEEELLAVIQNFILAGHFTKNAGYLSQAEAMIEKINGQNKRFNLEISLGEAEAALGGISVKAAEARFFALLDSYSDFLKKNKQAVADLALACTRLFSVTNNGGFVVLVSSLLTMPDVRLSKFEKNGLVFDCLHLLRTMKSDEKWGVTFFRF